MESRPTVRQPGLIVFLCGLATSLITLYLINVLEDHVTSVMCWYANKVIEIAGFAAGVMIPCLMLWKQPYCKRCHSYLQKVVTSYLPSSATAKEVRALRKNERKEAITKAISEVGAKAQPLIESLSGAT